MRRVSVCPKTGLRRGAWTPEEDSLLTKYITRYGIWNWNQIPKYAGLSRCGKSCRLRWLNYLRPNIRRGNFTKEEDEYIIRMHQKLGNRWSVMAASLPGRTDNEIKNHWNTHLSKCEKRISTSKLIKGEIMVSDTPTTQDMECTPTTQDIECSYDRPSSSSSYDSRSFYSEAKEQENPASFEAGWDFHCSFWSELFQVQHLEDISKQYSPFSDYLSEQYSPLSDYLVPSALIECNNLDTFTIG